MGRKTPRFSSIWRKSDFGLKDYKQTIQAIVEAGGQANQDASLISLKAESYWHLKETDAAINTLNEGQKIFPGDFRFLKRKVFYFVELGLYQEATNLGREYLKRSKAVAADYIALGNA